MKISITYKNRQIIHENDGTFTAFYSNYSSFLSKNFKSLNSAKNQIDKWLLK